MCLSDKYKEACIESHVEMTLREWSHYCFTVEEVGDGVDIHFYKDGKHVANSELKTLQ